MTRCCPLSVTVRRIPIVSEFVSRKRNTKGQRGGVSTFNNAILRVIYAVAYHSEICEPDGSTREVVTREHMRDVAENSRFRSRSPLRSELSEASVDGRCHIRIIHISANHECSKFENDVDIAVVDDIDIADDQLDVVDSICNIRAILDIKLVVCFAGQFHIRRSCSCNASFISCRSRSNRLRER